MDECVYNAEVVQTFRYSIMIAVFVVLRILFAVNIRDWRDRFHTKKVQQQAKAKKKAENEERMAAMGLQMV